MSSDTTSKHTLKAGVLSPQRASELLAQAVHGHAPIQLSLCEKFLEPCLWGVLVGEKEGKLLMEVRRLGSSLEEQQHVARLYATIELLDCRYFFDANLSKSPGEWQCGAQLEFHWPMTIAVEERRRSRRRQFQEADKATLVVAANGSEAMIDVIVLNVSLHGLACKISESEAAGLEVGSKLRVRMRIGGSSELFEEEAAIVNRTPAGSPGQVVLGMEFVAEPNQRFCDAIRTCRSKTPGPKD